LLIQALKRAQQVHPDLEIRIILGKAFDASDVEKFDKAIDRLSADLGLKRTKHIRFINQTMFIHCHNKMILVDGKIAVISSQNWSDTAVDTNREAGVVLYHADICRHFEQVFTHDWESGVADAMPKKPKFFEAKAFAAGNLVQIEIGAIAYV